MSDIPALIALQARITELEAQFVSRPGCKKCRGKGYVESVEHVTPCTDCFVHNGVAMIWAQRKRIAALEAALEPFAMAAALLMPNEASVMLSASHIRKARAVLEKADG